MVPWYTTNENTQFCFATLGVSFCLSRLGGIVAPVSNIGCLPNVACNVGQLSPSLGYNVGFFLKFDDNIGLKILLIPNVVLINIG